MLPAHDTAHVAEGVNNLIGQYRGKPNVTAVLTAALARAQDIEDALWGVINAQLLKNNPSGVALQHIADLLGVPPGSYSDAQLLFLVKIWVIARRSKGRTVDILELLRAAFPVGVAYAEGYPAAFEAWVPVDTDPSLLEPLAQAIRIARPPGVSAVLAWGDWPTQLFYWGDSAQPSPGTGWNDTYGGASPRGFLSAIQV